MSRFIACGLLYACCVGAIAVEEASLALSSRPFASNIVIPQRRAFAMNNQPAVQITDVKASVSILEQAATTTLEIGLSNPAGTRQEAELLVPVPEGAVVRAFTFQGSAPEATATLLPKDEARHTYESIVAKLRDPALLEFAGYNLVRSSVFPVEPKGAQRVRLTYEHLLPGDGSRVDYALPRSEALEYNVPWQVTVKIASKKAIATVYSPSHKINVAREGAGTLTAATVAEAAREPGPFLLSYIISDDGLSASLFAYPNPRVGGGYFLLVAGVPSQPPAGNNGSDPRRAIKREVTLVIDRSGSMNGEKIEQVREAALQVIAGLNEGEAFNILIYNEAVESFSKTPVLKSKETENAARKYIKGITAAGGTNIHDALLEALRQKPTPDFLPLVLFLTDGLPTVGERSEIVIRELATKSNPHERRVFTFGVGVDVNTPLLEKIALETRASSTFVLPAENVEVKVGQVFKRLVGPVLAAPQLETADSLPLKKGEIQRGSRVRDVLPARIPDLFEGDQLVVLGQYVGEEPLAFTLKGNFFGTPRAFQLKFPLEKATTRNAFVPRLWASRKIAVLVEAIRSLGADAPRLQTRNTRAEDPRLKELVDEVVRLSKEFGVLTEYTAFLATEGTNLTKDEVAALATNNFRNRAMQTRSGIGSLNQDSNNSGQRFQRELNNRNGYLDENMNRVEFSNVQQISDRAFFNRNGRWIDSRALDTATAEPKKTVAFGSDEFMKLVGRLAAEGRQGCVSLSGEILLVVDGETVLVNDGKTAPVK